MSKFEEKPKYDKCYEDPAYKMGPYRFKDTMGDLSDIVKDHGPFVNHVDISCGRGEVIDHIKSLGIESQGTEIVDSLVESREDVQFSWSDELPFADNSIEFLTNCDAMEHYPPELTDKILDEFFRVCSKVAYLTISANKATKHEMELHINIKPYNEWLNILSKYGTVTQRPYGRSNPVSEGYLVIKH